MKALQYFGPKDLRIVDIEEPEVKSDEVLMKMKKVGICGTDLHIYNGGMNVPTPLIIGHEFVGDIAKVGDRVKNVKVGDRAVAEHVIGCGNCSACEKGRRNQCKNPTVIGLHRAGALAEYMTVPANLVYTLPQELSYDEGVLVEPLSIAVYAVRKAGVHVGDTVAVIGQGPIGLLVDFVAKADGGTIFGFDKHDNRLSYARDHLYVYKGYNINEYDYMQHFKDDIGIEGADIVLEAVGSESSAKLSFDLARPGGKVVVLGVFEHDVMINMMHIVRKELEVMGSWTCLFSFDKTILLLKAQKIDAGGLITHRYPFTDSVKAFEDAAVDKSNRIKTVIEF